MEPLQHSAAGALVAELRARVEDWCTGRSALVRAPLLLWLAYIGVRHLLDPLYTSLFGPLNLALHEGGHRDFFALTVCGAWFADNLYNVLARMTRTPAQAGPDE